MEGKGKGKEGDRKGKGGEGGKGMDDLHPTLFLGPVYCHLFMVHSVNSSLLCRRIVKSASQLRLKTLNVQSP